jgi:hypothetical protein
MAAITSDPKKSSALWQLLFTRLVVSYDIL